MLKKLYHWIIPEISVISDEFIPLTEEEERECNTCNGTGKLYTWVIPGYSWGTVKGARNYKALFDCRECNGTGIRVGELDEQPTN